MDGMASDIGFHISYDRMYGGNNGSSDFDRSSSAREERTDNAARPIIQTSALMHPITHPHIHIHGDTTSGGGVVQQHDYPGSNQSSGGFCAIL